MLADTGSPTYFSFYSKIWMIPSSASFTVSKSKYVLEFSSLVNYIRTTVWVPDYTDIFN